MENNLSELFWQASLADIKKGYVYQAETEAFICLACGKAFTDGVIYQQDGHYYEARKFILLHIEREHRSVFHVLLNLDKKVTGLTEHQKALLELFYDGLSDNEVAKALDAGSTSTIRNHRFSLRERQKQAKVFLAIMELAGAKLPKRQTFIDIPRTAKLVDDRFAITEEENAKILAAAFKHGPDGPLESFPLKEKKRVAILRHILKFFEPDKKYSEKEVTAILSPIYGDYALLRRQLIEHGFMDRTPDGSSYWIKI